MIQKLIYLCLRSLYKTFQLSTTSIQPFEQFNGSGPLSLWITKAKSKLELIRQGGLDLNRCLDVIQRTTSFMNQKRLIDWVQLKQFVGAKQPSEEVKRKANKLKKQTNIKRL